MISWIVSTNGILTGLTSESSSNSFTADFGGQTSESYGGSTYFNTASGSNSSYSFSSQNSSGTTSSFYAQDFGDESRSTSESYTISDGTSTSTVEFSDSFSETVGGVTEESSSGLLPTMQSQSSTTQTFVGYRTDSTQTTAEVYIWTASQEETSDSVSFYQETATASVYSTIANTEELTRDTTTTVEGTMISSATALVVQANTTGPDAEIIYYVSSSALIWSGLSAASALANTATRTTLSNIYSTTEAAQILVSVTFDTDGGSHDLGIPSFSWSNESLSYSTQLTTSTSAMSEATIVTDSAILPNQTLSSMNETKETTTTSFSANLWTSNSGECSDQSKTTTLIVNISSSTAVAGSVWLGSMSWNAIRTGIASRVETTSTEAAYERNMSQSQSTSTYGEGRASGFTVEKNIALVVAPQVSTANVQNVSQSKFVPVFAQISTSSGQWFTVERSTFSSVAYAGVSRQGQTIFPTIVDGESYGISGLTYSAENGSNTTTSTASLGVSGGSTTTMLLNAVGLAGGAPNISESFAYGVSTAGVFKNRIDGQTTTLDVGATTFSESQSLSFFEPITGLIPVAGSGSTALFPVFWAVPRNSTALPPTMPPNA